MLNFEKLVAAFRQAAIKFDCLDMSLSQEASAEPILYSGSGQISQTADGTLEFVLYATESQRVDMIRHFNESFSGQPGTIVSDYQYYTLTAIDQSGNTWISERVHPSVSWSIDGRAICRGNITLIRTHQGSKLPGGYTKIFYFEDASLPSIEMSETITSYGRSLNRDKSTFLVDDLKISFQKLDGYFWISAESANELPVSIDNHLQQSIRFVLAQSLCWRAKVEYLSSKCVMTLCSPIMFSPKLKLNEPIQNPSIHYAHAAIGMFSCYLKFQLNHADDGAGIACSGYLHDARESSANSVDAWAVGLGVAIEGLVGLHNLPKNEAFTKLAGDFREDVSKLIASKDAYEPLKARVDGLLGMLTMRRPQDRMHSLSQAGKLSPSLIKSWKTMRNANVHPRSSPRDIRSTISIEKKLKLIYDCTALMYQIVFSIIGYNGDYSDYSMAGWPVSIYPPEPEALPDA